MLVYQQTFGLEIEWCLPRIIAIRSLHTPSEAAIRLRGRYERPFAGPLFDGCDFVGSLLAGQLLAGCDFVGD